MGRPVTSSEESRRSSRLGIGNNNNNKSAINNRPQTVGHYPLLMTFMDIKFLMAKAAV